MSTILPTSRGKHFESAFITHWFHSQSASTWNKNVVNTTEVSCDQSKEIHRRYCELYGVAGATEISLDAAVKAVLFNIGWHFRSGRLKIRTEVFCGHFFHLTPDSLWQEVSKTLWPSKNWSHAPIGSLELERLAVKKKEKSGWPA